MKKKIVFSFYISKDSIDREINRLHFKCLKTYVHVFDEMVFVLLCEDTTDIETISKAKSMIFEIYEKGDITIKIKPNSEFRESYVFKTEVVDRLGEDDLVFFAHNKGITNVEKYNKENIYKWVSGMYFYSLNFMPEVENNLINKLNLSYGSFLTKNNNAPIACQNKYNWFYIGTFFWVNSKRISTFIKIHNIELPLMANRFYDEEFLGNIFDCPPAPELASSHGGIWIREAHNYYEYVSNYIRTMYGEAKDFYEFYDDIIDRL